MTVGVFDNQYVVDQLRCQGIMQTCEVLKAGLPTRVGYDEVLGMVSEEHVSNLVALNANLTEPIPTILPSIQQLLGAPLPSTTNIE
jgi:hypothetical protein